MKKFLGLIIFVCPLAYANTTCTGKLNYVSLNPNDGLVQMNFGYGTQYHCKVTETWNSIDPESCQAVYSMLLAAQMAGKSIEARYNGDFTCSSSELGNDTQTQKLMYRLTIVN